MLTDNITRRVHLPETSVLVTETFEWQIIATENIYYCWRLGRRRFNRLSKVPMVHMDFSPRTFCMETVCQNRSKLGSSYATPIQSFRRYNLNVFNDATVFDDKTHNTNVIITHLIQPRHIRQPTAIYSEIRDDDNGGRCFLNVLLFYTN